MSRQDGEQRLVLISRRDPIRTSCGSESYLMAHARAAILAGYHPHSFSLTPRSEVRETDYGTLHRVFSPVRPPRSITSVLQRPWLVPAVCEYLRPLSGPHVIHAFGAWADTALEVSLRLGRDGVTAIPGATVFMAIEHETSAKLGSAVVRESLPWRLLHRLELAWVRLVTTRVEGRAFHHMRTVVVNYESVRHELDRRYGAGIPIRRLTYSPNGVHRSPAHGGAARATARLRRGDRAVDRRGQPPRRPQGHRRADQGARAAARVRRPVRMPPGTNLVSAERGYCGSTSTLTLTR
jgi:hypothetical protein